MAFLLSSAAIPFLCQGGEKVISTAICLTVGLATDTAEAISLPLVASDQNILLKKKKRKAKQVDFMAAISQAETLL